MTKQEVLERIEANNRERQMLADQMVEVCGIKVGDVVKSYSFSDEKRIVLRVIPQFTNPSQPHFELAKVKKNGEPCKSGGVFWSTPIKVEQE